MNKLLRCPVQSQLFDQWLAEQWLAGGRNLQLQEQVAATIAAIAERGDQALIEFTERFDGWKPDAAGQLRIDKSEIDKAANELASDDRVALAAAAGRIRDWHCRQLPETIEFKDELGNRLLRRPQPLASIAVYVPGGRAAYPSSLLMGALPAAVAGVEKMIFATPAAPGRLNPWVAHAAQLAGISEGLRIGGAQAIAALALGSETVARVDKIVGPGSAYVTEAKRQLAGEVGIDLLAGPSELVVIGDGSAPAAWTAADLAAQAEHGADSKVALISTSCTELDQVEQLLVELAAGSDERSVVLAKVLANAALIEAGDLHQARQAANRIAAEHLQLSIADAHRQIDQEWICGCLCAGAASPVVLSDYCAGCNHVLPTAGRVRFSSGLSVGDFMRTTSIFAASESGSAELAPIAAQIACGEGLVAHARAARLRLGQEGADANG
ncbi:MAG: histidinol dehydrogenase [Betaproteobacteria bacterium]|nr:histidinol dehydrogenase [Betaproteobacteria bacterium]